MEKNEETSLRGRAIKDRPRIETSRKPEEYKLKDEWRRKAQREREREKERKREKEKKRKRERKKENKKKEENAMFGEHRFDYWNSDFISLYIRLGVTAFCSPVQKLGGVFRVAFGGPKDITSIPSFRCVTLRF